MSFGDCSPARRIAVSAALLSHSKSTTAIKLNFRLTASALLRPVSDRLQACDL
jgi:hypothetical protein